MTERDFRMFKKLAFLLPVVTVLATLMIQWGYWQANAENIQGRFNEQKIEWDKRFEKIEREKAEVDVVTTKFETIDWKLNLIMKNLGVSNIKKDTL